MNRMLVETILFDFDGVVVDSEQLHLKALGMTLDQNQISYPDDLLGKFVGRSDFAFFQYVTENLDNRIPIDVLLEQKNKLFEIVVHELQPIKGFVNFIEEVVEKNIRRAIVTSSSRETLEFVSQFFNFKQYFDILVCEEDTTGHKPNPEPYLLAMAKTHADKNTTIVIEDSINGIKSGKNAGCTVFGLATSFDSDTLLSVGADMAFNDYDELRRAIQFK